MPFDICVTQLLGTPYFVESVEIFKLLPNYLLWSQHQDDTCRHPALYTSRTYGTPSSACPNNPSIHRHRHLSCSSWWGQDFVVVVLGLVHWVRWLLCSMWQRYCGYNRRRQLMTSVIRLWDKSHEDDLAKTNFWRMDRQRERPRESDRQDEDLFDTKPATICLCHLHVDPIHYSGCSVSRCVSLGRCWGEDVQVDRGVVGWVAVGMKKDLCIGCFC